MEKRIPRYLAALVISVITAYRGLGCDALAKSVLDKDACSLRDVAVWQSQINEPTEEATPAYIRGVTEDFITACPDRPERAEAHRIAGTSAVFEDQPQIAVDHFRQAGRMHEAGLHSSLLCSPRVKTQRHGTNAMRWSQTGSPTCRETGLPISKALSFQTGPSTRWNLQHQTLSQGSDAYGWPCLVALAGQRP